MICNYETCCCENSKKNDCACMKGIMVLVGIIGGIIFAAISALLFVNSLISAPSLILWTALVSALVYLFTIIAASVYAQDKPKTIHCIKCNIAGIFIGIFGTIFSGVIEIATTLTVGEIFPVVILTLTAFFFAYMIISALFLVKCIVD